MNTLADSISKFRNTRWSLSFMLFCTLAHYWGTLHFSNAPVNSLSISDTISYTGALVVPSLITAACFLALSIVKTKDQEEPKQSQQVRLLFGSAATGSISMFLGYVFPDEASLSALGYIAFAAYYFASIVCFVSRGSRMNLLVAFAYLFIGNLLASGIDLAINYIPAVSTLPIYLTSPLFSCIAIYIFDKKQSEENIVEDIREARIETGEKPLSDLPVQLFFIMLITGIIAGMDFYKSFNPSDLFQERYASLISAAIPLGGAITFLVIISKSMSLESIIHRFGFPIIASGAVLSLFYQSNSLGAIPLALSLIGTQLIVSLAWIICIFFHSRLNIPAEKICAKLFFPIFAGRTIGIALSGTVHELVPSPEIGSALVAIYFSLIYFTTFLYDAKKRNPDASESQRLTISWRYASITPAPIAPQPIEAIAKRIAERASLTPRETDVFLLMANGRNRKYIAEKLFISENTAKKHVMKIYDKLGIHSHQELLDVIDGEKNSNNGDLL